jgi:predicted GIY-YIG superfamily endonuclease
MSIGIYKITSPSNKIYIGQSINIERRIKQYKLLKEIKKFIFLLKNMDMKIINLK